MKQGWAWQDATGATSSLVARAQQYSLRASYKKQNARFVPGTQVPRRHYDSTTRFLLWHTRLATAMSPIRAALAAAVFAARAAPSLAWYATGHELVGAIAARHLTPSAASAVSTLLSACRGLGRLDTGCSTQPVLRHALYPPPAGGGAR